MSAAAFTNLESCTHHCHTFYRRGPSAKLPVGTKVRVTAVEEPVASGVAVHSLPRRVGSDGGGLPNAVVHCLGAH